jgi:DNA transposition AAA+ family ATPase
MNQCARRAADRSRAARRPENHQLDQTTMTTPAPIQQTPESELLALATAIDTYRIDSGLSKAQLLRSYPELGTDKTLSKIMAGDNTELKIEERWLPAYASVWRQLEGGEDVADAGLISTLEGPAELCRAYLDTRSERGNARFVLVLGDSGVGKSSAIAVMKSKPYGANVLEIEATAIWRDKAGKGTAAPLLRCIARRIGLRDLPIQRDQLLDVVVEKLQGAKRCLVIDEAHHLCENGINTIKTLINLTPVIIVAMAMPGLWDRLSGSKHGWAECKQLTGNRLAERIHLRLRVVDVERLMEDSCPELTPEQRTKGANALAAEAVHYGNLRFVVAVLKRYRREVKAGQKPSLETLGNAIALEKKKR